MVIWIYGQPCSGKTTLAELTFIHNLNNAIYQTMNLDGDELRKLYKNTSYDRNGRIANITRAIDIAKFLDNEKYNVVASFVTPYKEMREYLKELIPNNSLLVYLEYSASENRGREQNHVADFDIPTEQEYDLKLNTSELTIEQAMDYIREAIFNKTNKIY
jgi:adenylylsulfate kinase-like enzyme